MPKLAPYVARKGSTFLLRRHPPVHSALAGRGLYTRPHVAVALRTHDPRKACRLMEIPDEEVREILRALTAGLNALPGALPASRRVEAERRLNEKALRAFEGKPSRLDDPDLLADYLNEFSWTEMPTAAMVSAQLQCSFEGHFDAYVAAIGRGEDPLPEREALRAWLD